MRVHGGPDARGVPPWDFSTCANPAGPCPQALDAVRVADLRHYPDPASTAVRRALADLHSVDPARVLPAASASEFIQRMTAVTGRLWPGLVCVPRHAYGDYAAAALAWRRPVVTEQEAGADAATLRWCAEPSSPLGQDAPPPAGGAALRPTVLDAVYAPLRLGGRSSWTVEALDGVFVLHSPNKALGLTGVRGAYAIAPSAAPYDVEACCSALQAAAPSWPLSAQAEAMLLAWATAPVQAWVAQSCGLLAAWKHELRIRLAGLGFQCQDSVTPYFVARPPLPMADASALREHGVAVRDTASFGLPGRWRLSAQPPAAQDVLLWSLGRVERRSALG